MTEPVQVDSEISFHHRALQNSASESRHSVDQDQPDAATECRECGLCYSTHPDQTATSSLQSGRIDQLIAVMTRLIQVLTDSREIRQTDRNNGFFEQIGQGKTINYRLPYTAGTNYTGGGDMSNRTPTHGHSREDCVTRGTFGPIDNHPDTDTDRFECDRDWSGNQADVYTVSTDGINDYRHQRPPPDSSRYANRSTSYPLPKMRPFTGENDWSTWIAQFEAIARRSGLTYSEMLDQLLPRLEGQAAQFVFTQLTPTVIHNYQMLKQEMDSRFKAIETARSFASKFSRRSQQQNETLEEYAADLRRLYDKAHVYRSREARDEDLVRRFLDGLTDEELSFEIAFHKEPTTLEEAVYYAANYQQIKSVSRKEEKSHFQTHRVANDPEPYSHETEQPVTACPEIDKHEEKSLLCEMVKMLSQLGAVIHGRKRKKHRECYNCHREGHFARNCPLNNNDDGGTRQDMEQERRNKPLNGHGLRRMATARPLQSGYCGMAQSVEETERIQIKKKNSARKGEGEDLRANSTEGQLYFTDGVTGRVRRLTESKQGPSRVQMEGLGQPKELMIDRGSLTGLSRMWGDSEVPHKIQLELTRRKKGFHRNQPYLHEGGYSTVQMTETRHNSKQF